MRVGVLRILFLAALFMAFALPSRAQDQINTFPVLSAPGATVSFDAVPNYTRYRSTLAAPSLHIVQALVAGAPTACTYQVYGSLKTILQNPVFPADYFQLTAVQDCSTSTLSAVASTDRPALTILVNLVTLSGGTSPTVQFIYVGKVR
jgi:hypothetical protein